MGFLIKLNNALRRGLTKGKNKANLNARILCPFKSCWIDQYFSGSIVTLPSNYDCVFQTGRHQINTLCSVEGETSAILRGLCNRTILDIQFWGRDEYGEPETLSGLKGYTHVVGLFLDYYSSDVLKARNEESRRRKTSASRPVT